jgi:hypothetical protein
MSSNDVNLCNAKARKERISYKTLITRGYNHFNISTKSNVYATCEANGQTFVIRPEAKTDGFTITGVINPLKTEFLLNNT